MERDRYSGNCLFKVDAGNGEEEQKTISVEGGGPHTAPSMRYSERRWTSRFAVIGMYVRRSLNNEWKRKLYDSKIEINDIGILIPRLLPPPPPPPPPRI